MTSTISQQSEAVNGLRHLAQSLFFGRNPAHCRIVWFTGWYDASGSESDSPIVVVAGIAAPVDCWAALVGRWEATLTAFGVQEFHRKECKKLWPGDHQRLRQFLIALAGTLNADLQPTVVGVARAAYDAANTRYRIAEEFGGMYGIAQTVCVVTSLKRVIAERPKEQWPEDRYELLVEKGDCGQHAYHQMAREIGFEPGVIPRKDPTTGLARVPFQVADFIAGEHYRAFVATEQGAWPSQGNESFELIYERTAIHAILLEEPALIKMGSQFPR